MSYRPVGSATFVAEQLPLEQGLKRGIRQGFPCLFSLVAEQLPLEQGLKPSPRSCLGSRCGRCRTASTRTRIETNVVLQAYPFILPCCRTASTRTRIETSIITSIEPHMSNVAEQLPLEQGLKPYEVLNLV